MEDAKIWHLTLLNLTHLMLWRTSEREFRVVQAGDAGVLLTNVDYILFDQKFSSVMDMLEGQVIYSPVIVYDNVKKLTFNDYIEVEIKNDITPDSIKKIDSNGLKIWRFSESVFVSDDLKKEFEKMAGNKIKFSLAFSHFG